MCSRRQRSPGQTSKQHLQHYKSYVWSWTSFDHHWVPDQWWNPDKDSRIFPGERCWIPPKHHQQSSSVFSRAAEHAHAPLVWKWRELQSLTLWWRVLVGCWRACIWKSLNKSHRDRLVILMTHPNHTACHASLPCPRPLFFSPFSLLFFPDVGMLFLLFIPLWPPRWTHLKNHYSVNKTSFHKTAPSHVTPPNS